MHEFSICQSLVNSIIDEMEKLGKPFLAKAGFTQYEVSAYAREPQYCQHNLNYWKFGDYIGIGAGAHGKITDLNLKTIRRTVKHKHPKIYLKATDSFLQSEGPIPFNEITFEFMLNALRLYQPIDFALFAARTGMLADELLTTLDDLSAAGLVKYTKNSINLTVQGRRFLNDVVTRFL